MLYVLSYQQPLLNKPIPLLDDLLIVIVLFRQSLVECASYQSLVNAKGYAKNSPALLIYDNSPEPIDTTSLSSGLIYVHNPTNPGVSKAYNEAYKIARQLNKNWLLLVDQDTEFPSSILLDYSNAILANPQINIFAPLLLDAKNLVSPFQMRLGRGNRIKALKAGLYSIKQFKMVNSGMLISLDSFEKAGGYDERFALDYSDLSFLDRVFKNESYFALIPTQCSHDFSDTKDKPDLLTTLDRFKLFCKATCLYKEISIHSVILVWIIIPRAFKLAFKMKNLRFISIGIKYIYKKV